MSGIDWLYRRNNCRTCERAEEFLAKKNIVAAETRDARKATLDKSEALKIASASGRVVGTRGRKVIEIDVAKARPGELAALVVGPSGNLRAPAVRIGKTLLIGFDDAMYARELT